MAFETYRERLRVNGGSQSEAFKNQSVQIMNDLFFNSTACKSVTVDEKQYEARLITDKEFSASTTRESWKIQFKNNQVFPAGTYIKFDNKIWLVCKVEELGLFSKMYILECTYLLKWYDDETWELKEYWCPVLYKNSYSSGVWSNVFAQFVDMETKIWLPNNYDTRKIVRDKRFIVSNDDLNPTSYKVTKRDSSVLSGIMMLGLSEDEINPTMDNLKENIADSGKFQISVVFDIPDDYCVTVKQDGVYKLQIQAYMLNNYDGTQKYIETDSLKYTSLDSEIADIEGNTLTGVSDGTASIVVEYGNSSKQFTVNVMNDIQDTHELQIYGSGMVYLGDTEKYELKTSLNGEVVHDEYYVEVLDSEGKNISLLAKATASGNICFVKANSSNKLGYCTLKIKSLNFGVVTEKKLRIKSVL